MAVVLNYTVLIKQSFPPETEGPQSSPQTSALKWVTIHKHDRQVFCFLKIPHEWNFFGEIFFFFLSNHMYMS